MPSLNDLQNLQTDEVASFGQGEMFADADGGAGASESLPMGTYNFEPPKERQEVGALAAISKLLKSQQQMLRDENKKEVPNPRRVEMLTNEIAALLEKKEGNSVVILS
jgi:hypothetical protein